MPGKKRGSYNKYSAELRTNIGKYPNHNNTSTVVCYFTRKLKQTVSRSRVQLNKNNHDEELKQWRRYKQPEDSRATLLKKLPMKHCGKSPLLVKKLDILVQL